MPDWKNIVQRRIADLHLDGAAELDLAEELAQHALVMALSEWPTRRQRLSFSKRWALSWPWPLPALSALPEFSALLRGRQMIYKTIRTARVQSSSDPNGTEFFDGFL